MFVQKDTIVEANVALVSPMKHLRMYHVAGQLLMTCYALALQGGERPSWEKNSDTGHNLTKSAFRMQKVSLFEQCMEGMGRDAQWHTRPAAKSRPAKGIS